MDSGGQIDSRQVSDIQIGSRPAWVDRSAVERFSIRLAVDR